MINKTTILLSKSVGIYSIQVAHISKDTIPYHVLITTLIANESDIANYQTYVNAMCVTAEIAMRIVEGFINDIQNTRS